MSTIVKCVAIYSSTSSNIKQSYLPTYLVLCTIRNCYICQHERLSLHLFGYEAIHA